MFNFSNWMEKFDEHGLEKRQINFFKMQKKIFNYVKSIAIAKKVKLKGKIIEQYPPPIA